jgi:hypothetical protein
MSAAAKIFGTTTATVFGKLVPFLANFIALKEIVKKTGLGAGIVNKGGVFGEQYKSVFGVDAATVVGEREMKKAGVAKERQARYKVQEAERQRMEKSEQMAMRHDVYLTAPHGYAITETPGGTPQPAVSLGGQ